MIKLYQFAPAFGLANASPFCMKLETYLRMAALPFEIPCATLSHLQKAPMGKMPYIEDEGRTLADTTFIIDYLKARYGDPLDGWMRLSAPWRWPFSVCWKRTCTGLWSTRAGSSRRAGN